MNHLEGISFDRIDGIAIHRVGGRHSLTGGIERIRQVLAMAQAQGVTRLLIDITESTGYEPPSLSVRSVMMREWATAAGGTVAIAVVCLPEFIDPQRFGITMAARFGMTMNVFDNQAEALTWLAQI